MYKTKENWINEWLENNQPLLYSVASGVTIYGMDTDDIIQELNIICLRAAERFKEDVGTKFSTYAVVAMQRRIYEMGRKSHTNQKEFEKGMVSIDEEVGEDHHTRGETMLPWREITVEDELMGNERMLAVRDAFMALSPRNREIVYALCDNHTQTEVAKFYRLSQPLVSKIYKNFKADVLRRLGEYSEQ